MQSTKRGRPARGLTLGGIVVVLFLLVFIVISGCESKFDPIIATGDDAISASVRFVEWSSDAVAAGLVPILDGVAENLEWGSPDDPSRPYTYILLTPEAGYGDAGASRVLGVKCAYTAQWSVDTETWALRNVYFLIQWPDQTPGQYKDSLIYTGPNLTLLEPRILTYYLGLGLSQEEAQAATVDSLVHLFYDENNRVRPENWRQDGQDDRLMLFLGDGSARDGQGREFRIFGTQMLRNGNSFGPVAEGFVDAWEWSASRTNPQHEVFNPDDSGGDVDPQEGFAGFCDDLHIDAQRGLTRDSGPRHWIPNFDAGLSPDERIPLRAWHPRSDLNAQEPRPPGCTQINMGIQFPWLHRWSVRGAVLAPDVEDPKIRNRVVFKWDTKATEQTRLWEPGDFITGYLLGHDYYPTTNGDRPDRFDFCLVACPQPLGEGDPANCGPNNIYDTPEHSLATLQVRASGLIPNRNWILEVARPVNTRWGDPDPGASEPREDLNFAGLLEGPQDYYISFALWNDQDDGGAYLGSPPLRVHFEPPPPEGGR